MRVLVIGCGVIGLSTAIRLREQGVPVTIRAERRTPDTTSDVAAALYFPFLAEPRHRIIPWGATTHRVFESLLGEPEAGVTLADIVELIPAPHPGEPWWREAMPRYRRARKEELPPGYASGFVATVPIIQMPRYLRYLERRFEALGGHIEEGTVAHLASLGEEAAVVVNCTGLGARELVPDPTVTPVRGQIVRVENPGLSRGFLAEEGPHGLAYAIPRPDCVVLGGTADAGEWDLTPSPEVEERILKTAREIEPHLQGARVLSRAVGLRPGRPEIRLEAERVSPRLTVVHNYGHGGSGVTLSWGCAAEAAALALAALRSR